MTSKDNYTNVILENIESQLKGIAESVSGLNEKVNTIEDRLINIEDNTNLIPAQQLAINNKISR